MKLAGLLLLTTLAGLAAEPVDVAQIMARVAANQDAARDARKTYVYRQEQLVRMHRGNGKLAREERGEYVVTPKAEGFDRQLARFDGKYELKGKYIAYDHPGYQYKDLDIDGDLIRDLSDDMMNDQRSRDGIGKDLFPLVSVEQQKYDFRLVKSEEYRGRPVFRVAFHPKPQVNDNGDSAAWKGEALIDAEEYQPVMVQTSLAEKIPMAVKILLGTDVKGLGFSVTYQKFADGVWFPVSYGGEFQVRGLFFYKRNISVSMRNSDFKKADVKSTVAYATDAH